jgi:hypothetical protein
VIGKALIDPNIIFSHAARGEALLETASHFAAIQCGHPHRSDAGLIDIVDDHAGHPFVDHLWDRAGANFGLGDAGRPQPGRLVVRWRGNRKPIRTDVLQTGTLLRASHGIRHHSRLSSRRGRRQLRRGHLG